MQVLNSKKLLNCSGHLLSLDTPKVMGIINATPDSFYNNSRSSSIDHALRIAETMLMQGASILDIGAQSTRPGAKMRSFTDERNDLIPVIKAIHQQFPDAIISVDTFRASIAEEAIIEGASIINDVSGARFDAELPALIRRMNVPYVLMHSKGNPKTMQDNPVYSDVVVEVLNYFIHEMEQLKKDGLVDLIIDPGFGFAKTLTHNYQLLNHLNSFSILECPILVGLSRKKMIQIPTETQASDALHGTIAANFLALQQGASILRVHDVKAAWDTIQIYLQCIK